MLYGRDAERARIRELLDAGRESRSEVLLVRGEAGVGKTALLEDARRRAGDMQVLTSCGVESESQLPFAAVQQLVRPALDDLEALPEPQRGALRAALGLEAGGRDQPFLVSLAVLSLLAEIAERRPLLCLVDDAHWLDDASADALVFAARRLSAEPIVMLFAAREGDVRRFDALGLPELQLRGLDRAAARSLLADRVGAVLSPGTGETLIEGTGGNPLALLEVPLALSEAELSGAEPMIDPLPVGDRVEHAFLARLRRLPAATQTMLLVAAAEATGELATVLRAAQSLGAEAAALDAAERAGLVEARGSRLEFRHPLVRSAVYQGAPLSRRQAAHRALASALDGDADPDRGTWHRAAASVEPDPIVAAQLEQAAERALRRSGYAAASLALERAAALTEADHERARRLTAAAQNAWFGGRPKRALMLYDRARPLASDPLHRADISLGRGVITVYLGAPADAWDTLVHGAVEVGPADAERALYMLGAATLAAAYVADGEASAAIAEAGHRIRGGETPVTRFLSAFVFGSDALLRGAYADAAPALCEALEAADEADRVAPSRFPALLVLAGLAALFVGDDHALHRFNHTVAARARDSGALGLLTQAVPRLAFAEIWAGRWAAASAGLREGLELARSSDQHQVVAHMLCELALVAALRGDEPGCRALAEESHELAAPRGLTHVANTVRWSLALVDLGGGRADEALLHAREITNSPVALHATLDRVEAAVRAGQPATAMSWLGPFERWAQAVGAAWARGVALHGRALLCDDEAESDELFGRALDAHAGGARPFERARTQLAYGEHLRRARRRVEAREHLRSALDAFETLGAALWAERARVELRASGQTARRRDDSTRDELTAQELQISRFVARGLSNREVAAQLYLSPRTVDFHLRNVFRKLGIASRTELARLELASADADGAPDPAIPPVRA